MQDAVESIEITIYGRLYSSTSDQYTSSTTVKYGTTGDVCNISSNGVTWLLVSVTSWTWDTTDIFNPVKVSVRVGTYDSNGWHYAYNTVSYSTTGYICSTGANGSGGGYAYIGSWVHE